MENVKKTNDRFYKKINNKWKRISKNEYNKISLNNMNNAISSIQSLFRNRLLPSINIENTTIINNAGIRSYTSEITVDELSTLDFRAISARLARLGNTYINNSLAFRIFINGPNFNVSSKAINGRRITIDDIFNLL